jgi:ketosteroid isomerase-like protein
MEKSISIAILMLFFSCSANKTQLEQEIREVEQEFQHLANQKGLAYAFTTFADTQAIIHRNGMLINTHYQIGKYYSKYDSLNLKLQWSPDSIIVAQSGDLAFSFGEFQLFKVGKNDTLRGYYQTLWKRQLDGGWKYIWD